MICNILLLIYLCFLYLGNEAHKRLGVPLSFIFLSLYSIPKAFFYALLLLHLTNYDMLVENKPCKDVCIGSTQNYLNFYSMTVYFYIFHMIFCLFFILVPGIDLRPLRV